MKTLSIILMACLFFIFSQPLLCEAGPKGASAAAPLYKGEMIQITVAKGDWVTTICEKYLYNASQWQEVARINRLKNPNKIYPGEILHIPVAFLKGVPLEGKVTFVRGDAKMRLDGKVDWAPVKLGDTISQKSNLKTGTDSAVEVTFEDGSSFFLRSDTELGVLNAQKKSATYMIRDLYVGVGRILTKVREATGEIPRFKVHTPSSIASVRGTEFRIAVDQKQKSYAEVLEGRVAADAMNKKVEVEKGEGTVVKKGEAPIAPRKLLPPPAPVNLKAIYRYPLSFKFEKIKGAKSYRIMLARDREAKDLQQERIIRTGDTMKISEIDDGVYYLLTQSIDDVGLEGFQSGPHRVEVKGKKEDYYFWMYPPHSK